MSTKSKLEKVFGEIRQSTWKDAAKKRKENQHWLHYSQQIAISMLEQMDKKGISQKDLAEIMQVSPQLINKWVKGNENFTLETISKIETALELRIFASELDVHTKLRTIEFFPIQTEKYQVSVYTPKTYGKTSLKATVIKMEHAEYLTNCQ